MAGQTLGLCNECRARVPAEFFFREDQVWIRKDCPSCGATESLVSTDAQAWKTKRHMHKYLSDDTACTLNCDKCNADHHPNVVFLDVTNRCNMNCPICIATIRGMGFDYNPPLEYFDKIFAHISRWEPKPVVQLFGGEPTVRDDMFEIIAMARKYGLRPNVTTNGLRLADEDYCRKICEQRIGMRFAFDGFSADVYEKLRHNRPAYDKKVKALENIRRFTRRKQTIISCFAWGVNDHCLSGLIQYAHDNRDWVNELAIIPLAETWDPEEFDAAKLNTLEDVEKMVKQAIGDGSVEFVPAGMTYVLRVLGRFFNTNSRSEIALLAGVHPNCESTTLLVSDGKRYHGINHYLKRPFSQVAKEVATICDRIKPRLDRLDPSKFFQRMRGRLLVIRSLAGWALRSFSLWRMCEGKPVRTALEAIAEQVKRSLRRKNDDPTAARRKRCALRVVMLPFEEQHSVDNARLENCKAVFAYEDTDDGQIKTIPTCMWPPYRDIVLKKVSQKYGVVSGRCEQKVDAQPPAVIDEPAAVK